VENFIANYQAHLMMQMLGLGRTVLDTILGMMGIATSAGFKVAWATLRHAIGVAQQHLQIVLR